MDIREEIADDLIQIVKKSHGKLDGTEFTEIILTYTTCMVLDWAPTRREALDHIQKCIQEAIKTYEEKVQNTI